MSFGGGGGGFTFGSNNNNNQQQSTGFGGFGSGGNTSGGFGQSTGGFGTSTAGSNTFGGGTSAFGGGNSGGFGSSTNQSTSLFGSKPNPFGTSTPSGGGLFGNTSNTSTGFGGGSNAFGSNNNNQQQQQNAFGGGSSGGFGLNQQNNSNPFGTNNTSGSLFGQGGQGTTGGFGSTNAFGSGTALSNQPVPPSDGTASTPFQPTTEKESNGTTGAFQSIVFQPPYQKYSFEELRLADYNAGRKYGNASNQPGAFGSSAFGSGNNAFGQNSGGFGANNNTTAFGSNNSGGFGSNAATGGFGPGGGNSLFGNNQNKPAGLFGQQTSSGTTGGLFSTSNNTSSGTGFGAGFGTNNATNNTSGGSLFGQNNNQNKPAGLFGNTNTNQGSGFTFGQNAQSNTQSGLGLFGQSNNTTNNANTGAGLFGNNQQQQGNTGSSLFGNNQNQAGGSLFGNKGGFGTSTTQGQTGGSLFGNTGATNTGGGLFGNQSQSTNTGGAGLFGNQNQTANTGGSLFGNQNQNKPSLFGQQQNTNTGAGLFGNQNAGTNTGGGLFGNAGQNNQASGSLFGNNAGTGGGLFGNNQNQNKPAGLFGTPSTNNQGGGLFGNSGGNSLFGNSQNPQQNQMQQQEVRHASLLDPNPYGQSSIWTGLPAPTPENAKPVFTPLTATQKMKESMMKPPPTLRLNQSRYMTPPRRNGYGFSYSTYGTPSSAASTPGGASLSGSMYGGRGWSGGSFGRSFNRSSSVQNLRSQFANDADDIWKPNAFSPAHRNSSGSIKRLTIDRSIRQDLFSRPTVPSLASPKTITNGVGGASDKTPKETHNDITYPILPQTNGAPRRRVTFDKDAEQPSSLNSDTGALVRTEEEDSPNSTPQPSTTKSNEHTRTDGLSTVPEDRESDTVNGSSPTPQSDDLEDQAEGKYWMKPTREEMKKMPKDQLRHFRGFQVGRTGCATITFEEPVDLTQIDFDNLFGKEVIIGVRTVTVYPGHTPPRGTGLNVRSKIEIANSWPRSHNKAVPLTSGPLFEKHVNRLKHVKDTEFVDYRPDRGVWVFRVQHYTRYGLDYDDDEMDDSELSPPPDSIEKSADPSVMEIDDDHDDNFDEDDDNDTFAFKKSVPGGFGRSSMIDYHNQSELEHDDLPDDLSEHSGYSEDDATSEDQESPNMPGSLPSLQPPIFLSPTKPILKASRMDTPGKPLLDLEGDWADQLQRTISPRKQNRDVLRDAQNKILLDRAYQPIVPKPVAQQDFRSSIDIMNSLFAPSDVRQLRSKKSNKAIQPDFEV